MSLTQQPHLRLTPIPYPLPMGMRPAIDRIMRPRPPLPMPFIIFCICRKFLSSLLISATWVPEPDAIRRARGSGETAAIRVRGRGHCRP